MANIIVRADGTKVSVARATKAEIAAYIDEVEGIITEINNKAVAAGRQVPFKYPRMAAMMYEIIPRPEGGYAIKERKEPLIDDDTSPTAFVQTSTSLAAGLDRSIKRGKYNDSMRLIGEDTASIDVGELQCASGANNGMN